MKRSQSITLTVVAAMGISAHGQVTSPANTPVNTPANAPAQTCGERRKAAKAAGVPFTETCGHGGFFAHGTARGGFGATGNGNAGGG